MAAEAGVTNAAKYIHGDGAIHSSASKGHVVTSNFAGKSIDGGWNRIGLWNAISYGEEIDRILNGQDKSEGGETVMATAIVTAESGTTVNLRSQTSTSSG